MRIVVVENPTRYPWRRWRALSRRLDIEETSRQRDLVEAQANGQNVTVDHTYTQDYDPRQSICCQQQQALKQLQESQQQQQQTLPPQQQPPAPPQAQQQSKAISKRKREQESRDGSSGSKGMGKGGTPNGSAPSPTRMTTRSSSIGRGGKPSGVARVRLLSADVTRLPLLLQQRVIHNLPASCVQCSFCEAAARREQTQKAHADPTQIPDFPFPKSPTTETQPNAMQQESKASRKRQHKQKRVEQAP